MSNVIISVLLRMDILVCIFFYLNLLFEVLLNMSLFI